MTDTTQPAGAHGLLLPTPLLAELEAALAEMPHRWEGPVTEILARGFRDCWVREGEQQP